MKDKAIKPIIEWVDFEKIDFRSGTIVDAKPFEKARKPSYILHVDFGEKIGIKKSSAQITEQYTVEELIGMQVIAVINFEPKQIGPIMSECLVCGCYTKNGVVLITPSKTIDNGSILG